MKKDIHPDYHPVIFQDMTTGKQFITRSTARSDRKETVDGVEHFVISIGVTADSHPFFTGKTQFVDTEGRIDKFQKRFGSVRRAKKPNRSAAEPAKAAAKEAKAEAPKTEAPKVEEPKAEEPKAEEPKTEAPKVEAPKVEEPKVEEPKAEAPAETPEA